MNDLSPSLQKAHAAFLKVQKQSAARDRVLSDIAESATARSANTTKLREMRLARDRADASARAAAAALPKPRVRRARAG
jgi:hypothetical protein